MEGERRCVYVEGERGVRIQKQCSRSFALCGLLLREKLDKDDLKEVRGSRRVEGLDKDDP